MDCISLGLSGSYTVLQSYAPPLPGNQRKSSEDNTKPQEEQRKEDPVNQRLMDVYRIYYFRDFKRRITKSEFSVFSVFLTQT